MKRIFIMGVLVFLSVRALDSSSAAHLQKKYEINITEKLQIRDEVFIVVERWQGASGFELSKDARSAVEQGFAEEQPVLESAFQAQELAPEKKKKFIDSIVVHYLYDLRDRKIFSNPKRPAGTIPSHNFHAFLQFGTATDRMIDAADVRDFLPAAFIKEIRDRISKKVSQIDALSEPDLASITIDRDRKSEFTCRSFVVSPGQHLVHIIKPSTSINCSETVVIPPEETRTVICPKNVKIKCKLPN